MRFLRTIANTMLADVFFSVPFQISKIPFGLYYFLSYYNKALAYKKLGVSDSADVLFKNALNSYDQGYKIKDVYNETFHELYRDDIIRQIE